MDFAPHLAFVSYYDLKVGRLQGMSKHKGSFIDPSFLLIQQVSLNTMKQVDAYA